MGPRIHFRPDLGGGVGWGDGLFQYPCMWYYRSISGYINLNPRASLTGAKVLLYVSLRGFVFPSRASARAKVESESSGWQRGDRW